MAGEDRITVYRGEDVQLDFTMSPVVDITGWLITMTVEGTAPAKLFTVDAEIVDGLSGTYKVLLTSTETDQAPGAYQYDVWKMNLGAQRVLAVGMIKVEDVARLPTE